MKEINHSKTQNTNVLLERTGSGMQIDHKRYRPGSFVPATQVLANMQIINCNISTTSDSIEENRILPVNLIYSCMFTSIPD